MSSLVWSPVHTVLEDRISAGDGLRFLAVSFVKLDALKQLLWASGERKDLSVIVRWRIEDILSGVSDLEVYQFLKEKGIPLYFNEKIHLKLYVFESNQAFNTSANLTLKGLGYSPSSNIEVGNLVELMPADWAPLYTLIEESTRVDDAIFDTMTSTIANARVRIDKSVPVAWPSFPKKQFSITAFPASENPDHLLRYYLPLSDETIASQEKQRAIHDLVLLHVVNGLSRDEALNQALSEFRNIPFVLAFVRELQEQRSMRFGAVSNWVHSKCEDVPLPYRWEIKDSVRRLYNWLAAAYPEISWNIPNYSMVIYWNK
jgi:hypothetical protein